MFNLGKELRSDDLSIAIGDDSQSLFYSGRHPYQMVHVKTGEVQIVFFAGNMCRR
jgi:hypothetical protein